MSTEWIHGAANRYNHCIRDSLNWMLERKPIGDGLLNTKVNPLTGADYDHSSGLRGPDFTYGWIQGRGLEALVTFANHYLTADAGLSKRLSNAAQALYRTLAQFHARDEHVFFLYGKTLQPVRQRDGVVAPQEPAKSIFTYSDAFVAKGLFAASCQYDPDQSEKYLGYLLDVIAAIENGRFQMDETQALSAAQASAQPDDYGPRMILLGAAGVLHRNQQSTNAQFADRFIDDVLHRYFDPVSGLLLNVPGQDTCNVGHAIEFCGFAFEHLHNRPNDPRIPQLMSVLTNSLEAGLQGPGIALFLSATSGIAVSPYYPWWPLPEAIRACALGVELTNNQQLFKLWKQADDAFFSNYWQASEGFAYQTRTVDGPIDFVPATPDLDPGYHTGLSLLSAIRAMDNYSALHG